MLLDYGAKGAFSFHNMGSIAVRGREEPLAVYGLAHEQPRAKSAELASAEDPAWVLRENRQRPTRPMC